MKKIVVLGPNPAWQKTLTFPRLIPGEVNRAAALRECASGKGVNFCRAACLHAKAKPFLIQFTGGANGDFINNELNISKPFPFISIATAAPTRCCITCLDEAGKLTTELIEPSFAATASEVSDFLTAVRQQLADAAILALCGSLPTGTDETLYAKAVQIAAAFHIPAVADCCFNLDGLMASGAAILLKINAGELKKLSGEDTVSAGMQKLFATYSNLCFCAVTDGPASSFASDGKQLMQYDIPVLKNVINPIGCGDTASAAFSGELASGTEPFEAFRRALGCASANCLTPQPGDFSPEAAQQIISKITIKTI